MLLLCYVLDGEEVSEEENSGEEENLGILNLDAVKKDGDKRKRKKPKGVQARCVI